MKNKFEEIKNYIANQLSDDSFDIKNGIIDYVFSHERYIGMNIQEKQLLIKEACDQIIGYSVIQPLIDDEEISEIMINGNKIFYEKKGVLHQWERVIEAHDVKLLIQKICEKSNKTVNGLQPISDAGIEERIRTNIVLHPVSLNGDTITIRKFPENPITSKVLLDNGFFDVKTLLFLKMLVKAKYNIFICGGAGSGKTTLLNVLSEFIDENERIITIEDSAELSIGHIKNIVRLEGRIKNSEGKGEISIEQLIKTSLRMRPDRIIVGEVRGKEALDMLQAMNTGHEGSLSTGHSNSCEDMVARLETMILSNRDIPLKAITNQIRNAIDIFIFVSRVGAKRVLYEISEVVKTHKDGVLLNCVFQYDSNKEEFLIKNEFRNCEKMKRASLCKK